MKPCTSEELIQAFRPDDRRLIPLPNLEQVVWEELAYLGWKDPSGHRGFLATYDYDGNLRGVVMTFNKDSGYSPSGICDLCLSSRARSGTKAVLIETWSQPQRFVGLHICMDLDCNAAVTGKARSEHTGETINKQRKLERLTERACSFISRNT